MANDGWIGVVNTSVSGCSDNHCSSFSFFPSCISFTFVPPANIPSPTKTSRAITIVTAMAIKQYDCFCFILTKLAYFFTILPPSPGGFLQKWEVFGALCKTQVVYRYPFTYHPLREELTRTWRCPVKPGMTAQSWTLCRKIGLWAHCIAQGGLSTGRPLPTCDAYCHPAPFCCRRSTVRAFCLEKVAATKKPLPSKPLIINDLRSKGCTSRCTHLCVTD